MGSKTLRDTEIPATLLPDWAPDLPKNWKWHLLAEICSDIVDCPHSTPEVVDDGPYFMARTTDVLTGVFRREEARRVSKETYLERVQRAEPQYGDLLYSREGTYFGQAAEVPPETKVCLGQRMVLLRPRDSQVNSTYLRYWLNSPRIQEYIHGFRDGSVAERLNLPTIRRLPVCLPDVPDQVIIAHILGTLDDKIELNRRTNRTLEEIARTLFKSWFVDFDPVRAKAEGRPPEGMDAETAELFPSTFQESRLGPVPNGWSIQPIGEVVRIVGGSTPSTKNPTFWENGEIFWATPKDLSGINSPILLQTSRRITEAGLDNIGSGLLPPDTVLLSSRAPIGYLAISQVPLAVNQGFIAMLPSKYLPSSYLLFWSETSLPDILSRAGGTTFPEISKKEFRPLPLVVPPKALAHKFAQLAEPFFQGMVENIAQESILSNVRDTILPRLLLGGVKVDPD